MEVYTLFHYEEIDDFLWEVVTNKIEGVNYLPEMLQGINNISDKTTLMLEVEKCDIIDTNDFKIIDECIIDDGVLIQCETDYIMITSHKSKESLRIQGILQCEIIIPREDYDWDTVKKARSKKEMLSNKDIVSFKKICFKEVEADLF